MEARGGRHRRRHRAARQAHGTCGCDHFGRKGHRRGEAGDHGGMRHPDHAQPRRYGQAVEVGLVAHVMIGASSPRALLESMFQAAIASAQPAACIPRHLPPAPRGRLIVLGAGKASAAMARAVEEHWKGPLAGLRGDALRLWRYMRAYRDSSEAGHPVPDAAGMRGAERMLALAQNLGADDLVLCLISRGGSACCLCPHRDSLSRSSRQWRMALLA